ncbi:MAG: 3-methylcrotonyl-CoA carboxylase alpha subunit [Loktanella salsilacus]|jgi:3-methylcrotonyl-CoA carboxylase alpha subunit
MKMEHVLRAPRSGIVAQVAVTAGDQVKAGVALVTLAPEDAA